MTDSWYRRNPADFLDGVADMSLELIGAYTILLDTMYLLNRPLHDDDHYIAGLLRVSTRKWRSLRQELIARGKIVETDGKLDNVRAQSEREKRANVSRVRADAGRKGGEKGSTSSENKDLFEANASSKSNQIREDKKRGEKESGSNEPAQAPSFSKFIYAKGRELLSGDKDPPKDPGGVIRAWLRDHGESAVLEALRICEAKQTPEPLSYINGILNRRKKEGAAKESDSFGGQRIREIG